MLTCQVQSYFCSCTRISWGAYCSSTFSLSLLMCVYLCASMANLKIELSKLKSEAWPGALDIEKEKLMLINEKEELLKELQFVTPCKRTQDELEHLEAERKRLEEELSVKSTPSDTFTER